jgi:hypothetical protein
MLKARNAIGSLIGTVRIDPRRSRGRTTWRDQIAMATEPAHHGLRAELETTCQNRQPTEVDNWRERDRERVLMPLSWQRRWLGVCLPSVRDLCSLKCGTSRMGTTRKWQTCCSNNSGDHYTVLVHSFLWILLSHSKMYQLIVLTLLHGKNNVM